MKRAKLKKSRQIKTLLIALILVIAIVVVVLFPQPSDAVCGTDADCVPAQCCHPVSCVPLEQKPDCTDILCTLECKPNTLDCSQGSCACEKGKCIVKWKE